jgi:S-adenosylmethionine:tRNA ribosyltransferase-isomerase
MVVDRSAGRITERVFRDIEDYIGEGDCLVLNNTRVVPARLYGTRKTGGKVEIFILDPASEDTSALVRPAKRVREGEEVTLENGATATVGAPAEVGRHVTFSAPLDDILKEGHVPLPPYIERTDEPLDREAYQTVYAQTEGATASPTAGLHFTYELLQRLKDKGVKIAYVTLHTSYGTFAPVREENVEDHVMHSEYYKIGAEAAGSINSARSSGGRVVAVGTTSTRVLETASDGRGRVRPREGWTDLFIYPGYRFKAVDSVITNFHLPESTLLMLVCAFAGKDIIFEAYGKAVEESFRFFSYGDAMLIL